MSETESDDDYSQSVSHQPRGAKESREMSFSANKDESESSYAATNNYTSEGALKGKGKSNARAHQDYSEEGSTVVQSRA